MSITWGDIKRKVRYKGDYDEDEQAENEFMFADAATEALSHLQHDCPTVGKFTIPVFRAPNKVHADKMLHYMGQPISFTATAPKCLRYTVIGTCTVTYYINNVQTKGMLVSGVQTDKELECPSDGEFRITFTPTADRSFIITDVGIFDRYDFDGDVPQSTEYFKYDLLSLSPDFLELDPDEREPVRIFVPPYGYVPASDYHIENDRYLYINARNEGNYEMYYHKRLADMITPATGDRASVDLDDTQIELLVCYMAYELEKYHDIQVAYTFLNDYNSQLAAYMNRPRVQDVPVVISTKGWW